MALVLADRVKETTTTTGTGTVTLAGASAGYQSFAAVGNANTTYYTIAGQTTTEWEVGIGTYTASGTTLSRDTILSSSNSGSAVNFSAGTKDVFVTYPSSRSVYANGSVLTASNSSILPIASGGTGSATLAGANIALINTAQTFTATQTFNGTTATSAVKPLNIAEPASVSGTAPTATTNFYINSGAVQYITGNNANNWTLNFAFSSGTSLNTAMATNDSISCTLVVTNSTTAYYPSAFTIDGTSVTPKWQGGTAPTSGNASSIDSYTFVIIKTASATYTVLAAQTKFA
jgi:hypothetical protein